MRNRLASTLLVVTALGCSEPSSSGPPADISGSWAFSQSLVGQVANSGCKNHGRVTVTQDATTFTATYSQVGFCFGPGGADNSGSGTIVDGRVNGNGISFSTDACRYRGNVVGELPDGAEGTVTCRVTPMGGGPAVSYSGGWRVSHGAATVTVSPSEAIVGEGEMIPLVAAAYDASDQVMTREFRWSTGNPPQVEVTGNVVRAVSVGATDVTATTVPALPLEDSVAGSAFVRVFYAFAGLAAGWLHTCGVQTTGGALCWGPGYDGRLGNGGGSVQLVPAPVAGSSFMAVSGGIQHSCGITTAGTAYCWGRDLTGELGNGPPGHQPSPSAVAGGLVFASISAGNYFTCAVRTGGQGYCWGYGFDGRLGDSTRADHDTPAAVAGGLSFTMISTSKNAVLQPISDGFACGITVVGAAYCWGRGPLGNDSSTTSSFPIPVTGGFTFSMVSAGQEHACALTTTGAAYCWGRGADGQLGSGTTNSSSIPIPVSGGLTFTNITAGGSHTCAVTTSGAAYCWGGNLAGQLGIGSTSASVPDPTPVAGTLSFQTLVAGAAHTCGVTTGRVAYCWGRGLDGQLGNGAVNNLSTPQLVGY